MTSTHYMCQEKEEEDSSRFEDSADVSIRGLEDYMKKEQRKTNKWPEKTPTT